jgi:hypothetical protein
LRQFDIHKVPAPCRFVKDLGRVAVTVPILICPCRLARDVVVSQGISIGREEPRHLSADGGVEIVLGDESDDLVTFVALSDRWTWCRQGDGEQKPGEKRRFLKVASPCGSLMTSSLAAF